MMLPLWCESGSVRRALEIGYAALGLDLRPQTVGCVADTVPGVTVDDARREIVAALGRVWGGSECC